MLRGRTVLPLPGASRTALAFSGGIRAYHSRFRLPFEIHTSTEERATVETQTAENRVGALLNHVRSQLSTQSCRASPLVLWPLLTSLPKTMLPSSVSEAVAMLRVTTHSSRRRDDVGKNKASGNGKSSGGGDGTKGKKGSGGGEGDGEGPTVPPIDDENNPEQWLVPRTVLFVLIMFVLTLILYRLSLPSGQHTGWTSLMKHAGEIRQVALYNNYAQVYLDRGKVYLGLVHDHDTQKHMEALADEYTAAVREQNRQQQQQQQQQQEAAEAQVAAEAAKAKIAPASEVGSTSEQSPSPTTTAPPAGAATPATSSPPPPSKDKAAAHHEKPEELPLVMKGTPMAENALVAVGVFAWIVPFVFFPVFVMFLSQYIGKSMTYAVDATKTKSKVKDMVFKVESSSGTRFRDIAGMKEPKKEITEIVDFLRHPERYTKLGAKIPTGALLLGPPGTGKTLLAKAVAGESGVGFIPVCGSDFVELYVGMGALRVRQLFKEARKQRCIVYIDEIDAIGLKRQGAGHGEKQEQEQTLNELLTQLDGFSTGKRGDLMILASSNVAQEALDPALIRPGRFDRIIHVDTPVIAERIDIFKVHLSKLKLTPAAPEAERAKQQEGEKETEPKTATVSTEQNDAKEGSSDRTKTTTSAANDATADTQTVELPSERQTPPAPVPNTTETRLIVSSLEEEKKGDGEILSQETDGHFSFDFRSLLIAKSDQERALIDAYAHRMSNLCPGFVGADIANVCNEGAILAAREGADHVDIRHLERSIDRVLAGIEHRSRVLSAFEKNVVAHHEAGHAVAGWFLNRADPLMKVSIVPRGGSALGYAQYLPNENYTRTAQEIRDSISVTLGGRVAEQIFFNHLSTGASDDLRKVGNMAYLYVSAFSPGSVYPAPGSSATRLMKPFGASKANDFDRRARQLVDEVYADTHALLLAHKQDMERLAQHLLKYEVLTYQDVVNYLGERGQRARDKRSGV